jgi:hypothetical protein
MNITRNYQNLCEKFVEWNDLEHLQYIIEGPWSISKNVSFNKLLYKVCKKGRLEILKWLLVSYMDIEYDCDWAFEVACTNGHLEIAQCLYKYKPDINMACESAIDYRTVCSRGYIDVAEWMLKTDPSLGEEVALWVLQTGVLENAKEIVSRAYARKENNLHLLPKLYKMPENDLEEQELLDATKLQLWKNAKKDVIQTKESGTSSFMYDDPLIDYLYKHLPGWTEL